MTGEIKNRRIELYRKDVDSLFKFYELASFKKETETHIGKFYKKFWEQKNILQSTINKSPNPITMCICILGNGSRESPYQIIKCDCGNPLKVN
jgi:hypothetical protein